jgi:hypothetical protein
MDTASYDRSWPVAGDPLPYSSISFGMTLVMAIACGVAAANIYAFRARQREGPHTTGPLIGRRGLCSNGGL